MTRPSPRSWKVYLGLLGSPLLVVAIVASLATLAVNILGAVRAYAAGESVWSKSRSDAVQHALRYASSHDPAEFERFQTALAIPLADQQAREAMERQDENTEAIRQALIAGHNHPDDVDKMIRLFRWFGDRWVMKDARDTWAHGDRRIGQLQETTRQLHQAIQSREPKDRLDQLSERIDQLDIQLNEAGLRFNRVLGQAARVTEWVLIGGISSIALLLSLVSFMQVRQVLIKQARYQENLDRMHRHWELASSAGGFGLYEMDKDTDIIQLDTKAAAMHGMVTTETITVPRTRIRELIVHDDALSTRQNTDQALQNGNLYKIIYRVRHPDGQIRALEATGRLVQTDPSHAGKLMGVLRDITDELKQTEAALKQQAAERVAQAQRDFLSRLSHELRTPLNAILGFAQLMQMDRVHATPTQQRQADMILDAGKQLLSLVEDVLDLSKVESGHVAMQLQPTDAAQCLRQCAALISHQLKEHQLTWVDQLPQQPTWVLADPQRLQQVWINLLTNACKYNRCGGQVTVSAQDAGDMIRIDIADTGAGLSEGDIAELFQPFKRVNPSPRIDGTGLGLYIVKLLVERMHGQVNVRSEPGKGSVFSVHLPADTTHIDASKPLV